MINIIKALPYIKSMKIDLLISYPIHPLSEITLYLSGKASLNFHLYVVVIVTISQYVTDKSNVTFVQCLVGLFQLVLLVILT